MNLNGRGTMCAGTERSRGRGNCNHNILHKKKLFSRKAKYKNKIKKEPYDYIGPTTSSRTMYSVQCLYHAVSTKFFLPCIFTWSWIFWEIISLPKMFMTVRNFPFVWCLYLFVSLNVKDVVRCGISLFKCLVEFTCKAIFVLLKTKF